MTTPTEAAFAIELTRPYDRREYVNVPGLGDIEVLVWDMEDGKVAWTADAPHHIGSTCRAEKLRGSVIVATR